MTIRQPKLFYVSRLVWYTVPLCKRHMSTSVISRISRKYVKENDILAQVCIGDLHDSFCKVVFRMPLETTLQERNL